MDGNICFFFFLFFLWLLCIIMYIHVQGSKYDSDFRCGEIQKGQSINTSIKTGILTINNNLHKGSSCASPRRVVLLNNGNYCATHYQHIFSNLRTKCQLLFDSQQKKKCHIASVMRMDILLLIPSIPPILLILYRCSKEEVACLIRQISHFNTSRLSGEVSETSPELIV